MTIIKSLKTLEQLDAYTTTIEKIVKVDQELGSSNEFSDKCVNLLPSLNHCKEQVYNHQHMKFMLNVSESIPFVSKVKKLVNAVANPFLLPTVDIDSIEQTLKLIQSTRENYVTGSNYTKQILNDSRVTTKYSLEDVKLASQIFEEMNEKISSLNFKEFISYMEENRTKAAQLPIFQDELLLKLMLDTFGTLDKTATKALDNLDNYKKDLADGAGLLITAIAGDVIMDVLEENNSRSTKTTLTINQVNEFMETIMNPGQKATRDNLTNEKSNSPLKKPNEVSENIKNLSDKFNEVYDAVDKEVEKKKTMKNK